MNSQELGVAEDLADPVAEAAAWLAAHGRDVAWLRPSELMAEIGQLRSHLAAVLSATAGGLAEGG